MNIKIILRIQSDLNVCFINPFPLKSQQQSVGMVFKTYDFIILKFYAYMPMISMILYPRYQGTKPFKITEPDCIGTFWSTFGCRKVNS